MMEGHEKIQSVGECRLSEYGKVYDSATNEVIDLFENVRVWHYTQDSMPPDDSTILVTTLSGEVLFARYFEKDMDFIVAARTSKGLRAERYDPAQIMAWMELPGAYIPGKRGGEE